MITSIVPRAELACDGSSFPRSIGAMSYAIGRERGRSAYLVREGEVVALTRLWSFFVVVRTCADKGTRRGYTFLMQKRCRSLLDPSLGKDWRKGCSDA